MQLTSMTFLPKTVVQESIKINPQWQFEWFKKLSGSQITPISSKCYGPEKLGSLRISDIWFLNQFYETTSS